VRVRVEKEKHLDNLITCDLEKDSKTKRVISTIFNDGLYVKKTFVVPSISRHL